MRRQWIPGLSGRKGVVTRLPMYVHVDIKKIINKNKNIFEKMSEYVGFSPPPRYFLHIRCDH